MLRFPGVFHRQKWAFPSPLCRDLQVSRTPDKRAPTDYRYLHNVNSIRGTSGSTKVFPVDLMAEAVSPDAALISASEIAPRLIVRRTDVPAVRFVIEATA